MSDQKVAKTIRKLLEARTRERAQIAQLERELSAMTGRALNAEAQIADKAEVEARLQETQDTLVVERRRTADLDALLAAREHRIAELAQAHSHAHVEASSRKWAMGAVAHELCDTGLVAVKELLEPAARSYADLVRAAHLVAEALALAKKDLAEMGGIEKKRAELEGILANVRGRMRRRELEMEQAILNREALVSVQPKVNRR